MTDNQIKEKGQLFPHKDNLCDIVIEGYGADLLFLYMVC